MTSDVDKFWKVLDAFEKDSTVNPFGRYYIDIGSAGVGGFIPNRIESDANLFQVVKKRRADYKNVRAATLQIKDRKKQCRSVFHALKYWYSLDRTQLVPHLFTSLQQL